MTSFFIPLQSIPTTTAQQKGVRMVNGKIIHYTKPEVVKIREMYVSRLIRHKPAEPMQGAVAVSVVWCFPASTKHQHGDPHTIKPDGDNLTKLLLDAMTETCYWKDDCQIAKLTITKVWQKQCGIYITYAPLEDLA